MSKVITFGLSIIALFIAWTGYQYWVKLSEEQQMSQAEAERAKAAVSGMNPRSLPGMNEKSREALENALEKAQRQGAAGLREWLANYGKFVEDPRRAWIELDYCVLVARENPAEARRAFAEVKGRTSPSSPVYPRIKQLEKTYE